MNICLSLKYFLILVVFCFCKPGLGNRLVGFVSVVPTANESLTVRTFQSPKQMEVFVKKANIERRKRAVHLSPQPKPGIYYLDRTKKDFIIASEYRLHFFDSGDQAFAWLTRDQKPGLTFNQKIEVFNCARKKVSEVNTGSSGIAQFKIPNYKDCPNSEDKTGFLFASIDSQMTALRLDQDQGYEAWNFPVYLGSGSEKSVRVQSKSENRADIFLSSTVLRQGGELHFFAAYKGKHHVKQIRLTNISTSNVYGASTIKSKFNSSVKSDHFAFNLPEDIPSGVYSISYLFQDGFEQKPTETIYILKKSTQPLQVQFQPESRILLKDSPTIPIKFKIPFERKMNLTVNLYARFVDSPLLKRNSKIDGYNFNLEHDFFGTPYEQVCRETIDGFPVWARQIRIKADELVSVDLNNLKMCGVAKDLLIEAEIVDFETDRRRFKSAITVFPEKEILGLKAILEPEQLKLSGVIVDSKSEQRVKPELQAEVFGETKEFFFKKTLGGGYTPQQFYKRENLTDKCAFSSSTDEVNCQIVSSNYDRIHVLAAAKNHTSQSDLILGSRQKTLRSEPHFYTQLTTFPDRELYKPGDTARLFVGSPYYKSDVITFITVNGKTHYRRFELLKSNPYITIPITDELVGNIYIAFSVRGISLTEQAPRHFIDQNHMGLVHFNVSNNRTVEFEFKPSQDEHQFKEVSIQLDAKAKVQKFDAYVFHLPAHNTSWNGLRGNLSGANYSYAGRMATSENLFLDVTKLSNRGYPTQPDSVPPFEQLDPEIPSGRIFDLTHFSKVDDQGKILYKLDANSVSNSDLTSVVALVIYKDGTVQQGKTSILVRKMKQLKSSPVSDKPVISLLVEEKRPAEKLKTNLKFATFSAETPFLKLKNDYTPSLRFVLDKDNILLGFNRNSFVERRLPWLSLDEVPERFIKTLLTSEDKDFFNHSGVDWTAMGESALNYIQSGPQSKRGGASTISMQLTKMLNKEKYLPAKSVTAKFSQIQDALQLEKTWSKNEILEAYLNLVPFKGDLVGASAAARFVFGKEVLDLDVVESSYLVALIPSPNSSAQRIQARMCRLLQETQCEKFDSFVKTTVQNFESNKYFTNADKFDRSFLQVSSSKNYLQTSLRLNDQSRYQRLLDNFLIGFKNRNLHNGAIVAIDNKTKEVLAYVQNTSNQTANGYQVDMGSSPRSPGSVLKPFIYAEAIENKKISMHSLINDSPYDVMLHGDQSYAPKNHNLKHAGLVTAAEALGSSLNIPAVKVYESIDKVKMKSRLVRLGMGGLDGLDISEPSFVLGSIPISLLELTRSYSSLFYSNSFSKKTIEAVASALSYGVFRIYNMGLDKYLNYSKPFIVKTGTSTNENDSWCILVSENITVGIWLGNSDKSPPWSVGPSNAAHLMQQLVLASNFESPRFKLTDAQLETAAGSKKIEIVFPQQNMVIKGNSIPVRIEGIERDYQIKLNTSLFDLGKSNLLKPQKGKNILQLLDHKQKELHSIEFNFIDKGN